jgi:hypothetical protein
VGLLLDRLRATTISAPAPAWAPKPGDGIEGIVVSIDTRPGDGQRRTEYPVVVIDTSDLGQLAWHAAGAIAKEQLDLHRPKTGDTIAVLYSGEQTSKRGAQFKRWTILVEHIPTPGPRPHRDGTENGPDDYPDNIPIDPQRALIISTLNDIDGKEMRHRAKLTFASRFGDPRTLPANQLSTALAWTQSAAVGKEILDPL